MTEFADHVIVSRVEADGFASWLIQRRRDGRLERAFWCRVTAADGLLRVTGDFDPTVFAHGPSDPTACLRWIGERDELDGYRAEKASIGAGGRDRISSWRTADARDDMRRARDEMLEQDPGCEVAQSLARAIDEALESRDEYEGEVGCLALLRAAMESEHARGHSYDLVEAVGHAGRRVSPSVHLAVRACARLVQLLDAERAEP